MRARGLIDTGPIVAMINRADPWHDACVSSFQSLRVPLVTSVAVLTETFHLLGNRTNDVDAAWQLVRSGAMTVGAIANDDLSSLNGLMLKYRDRPMDFADATLVHLAQREAIHLIFTIDHDDFETYRIEGRKMFRIVPGREELSRTR
jgi:predicted nucleic acid-binding protein